MGFSQFWQVINFQSEQLPSLLEEICFDFHSFDDSSRPWIVIDWNNYAMSYALSDGGFPDLAAAFFQQHFTSILNSGARICIIRDGKFNEQRLLIKLKRVYDDMIESFDPSKSSAQNSENAAADQYVIKSNELVRGVVMRCAKEMLQSYIKELGSDYKNINNANAKFIYRTADQEADDEIRTFCSQRLSLGDTVYVLSRDASLVLGVPQPEGLHLVSISSFRLSGRLTATMVNIGKFVERLNVLSNMMCALPGKVHMEHLPSILALIDSETFRSYTSNQYFDPRRIVEFMKDFFAPRKKLGSRALGLFLMATVVTKAILHHMNRTPYTINTMSDVMLETSVFLIPPGTYRRFIDDVIAFAENLMRHGQFGNHLIAGFPPHREASPWHLSNVAKNILQHSEMKHDIPLAMVPSLIRFEASTHISHPQERQQRAQVRFLSTQEWFPASIRTLESSSPNCVSYIVLYDAENTSPQYNQPCGLRSVLAREHTVREICQRIVLSSVCSNDACKSLPNDKHQLWEGLQFGVWCQHEPMAQETEKMLLPLISLVRQIQFINESVLPWYPTSHIPQDIENKSKFAELYRLAVTESDVLNLLNKWRVFFEAIQNGFMANEFEFWMVEMKTLILQLEDAYFRLVKSSAKHFSDDNLSNVSAKKGTSIDAYDNDVYNYDYDYDGNKIDNNTLVNCTETSVSKLVSISNQRTRYLTTSKVYLMQKQRSYSSPSGVQYIDFPQLFTHFALPHPESGTFPGQPLIRHGIDIFENASMLHPQSESEHSKDKFSGVVIVRDVAALHTPPDSAKIDVEKVLGLWCGYIADDPENVYFSRYKDFRLCSLEPEEDDYNSKNKLGVLLNKQCRYQFFQFLLRTNAERLSSIATQNETATDNVDNAQRELLQQEAIIVLQSLFCQNQNDDLVQALSALYLHEGRRNFKKALTSIERYLSDIESLFSDSDNDVSKGVSKSVSATMMLALLYALRHMCLPPSPEALSTTETTAFTARIRLMAEKARVSLLQQWSAAILWSPFFGQWNKERFAMNTHSLSLEACKDYLQSFNKETVISSMFFPHNSWIEWTAKTKYHIDLVDIIASNLVTVISRRLDFTSSSKNFLQEDNNVNQLAREVTNASVQWYNSLGMAMAFQVLETEALHLSSDDNNTLYQWIMRMDTKKNGYNCDSIEDEKKAKVRVIAESWNNAMKDILSTMSV